MSAPEPKEPPDHEWLEQDSIRKEWSVRPELEALMSKDMYEVVIETRNIRTGQRVRQTYWRCSTPAFNGEPMYVTHDGPGLKGVIDEHITFRAEPDPEHDGEIGRYEG